MSWTALTMLSLACASGLILWWIYDGYLRLLSILPTRRGNHEGKALPNTVTVLITAWNEEAVIEKRVHNALSIALPDVDLLVMVASDGSTDRTNVIVESINDPRVMLLGLTSNVGKTAAQNAALDVIDSDIVILTDAGSTFSDTFQEAMLAHFADPTVGLVDATVRFTQSTDAIGAGQSRYWCYEQRLRRAETRVGIQAVASGAGLAIRRSLIQSMREDVGEDCLLPLQVIEQGFRVVHADDAVVTDRMPDSPKGELRARSRMTARNWIGTWSHAKLLNPLRHPRIALGLWSHKVLRWLSPIFLVALLVSTSVLGAQGNSWFWIWLVPLLIVGASSLGGAANYAGVHIPLAGAAWSFMLANVGFAAGLWQVLLGKRTTAYRNKPHLG